MTLISLIVLDPNYPTTPKNLNNPTNLSNLNNSNNFSINNNPP